MATFQGVGANGTLQTITAPNANAAIATPGLAPHSGVITNPPGITAPAAGPSIADQLATIKAKALDIQSKITSDSGTARADEANMGTAITTQSNPNYTAPTNNMKYLDSLDAMLSANLARSEDSINSNYASDLGGLETAQTHETGSTSVGVARMGGYLGNSGSGMGVLQNLAVTHRSELAQLESKRQEALQAAREGFATKSFALAKDRLDEANRYEKEAYDRQQTFYTQTQKVMNEQSIASAMSGGAKSAKEIFDKLGGKVSIEDINSYIKGVTPDTIGAFKLTSNDTAKLLGSGLSQNDIVAAQDYITQHGYSDEFRNKLTPRERTVFDSIYYPKSAAGAGGALTIAEAKSLGLPTSIIGRTESQIVADLNNSAPPSWYKDYVASSWADPSAQVNAKDPAFVSQWNTFRNQVLGQNISGNPYEVNKPKGTSDSIDFNSIPTT